MSVEAKNSIGCDKPSRSLCASTLTNRRLFSCAGHSGEQKVGKIRNPKGRGFENLFGGSAGEPLCLFSMPGGPWAVWVSRAAGPFVDAWRRRKGYSRAYTRKPGPGWTQPSRRFLFWAGSSVRPEQWRNSPWSQDRSLPRPVFALRG